MPSACAKTPRLRSLNDRNVWSEYEIEAHNSLVDRPLRNLKHGDAFAVLDADGDIGAMEDTAEGLFYRDTRYLSHFELRIEGKKPLLLSSVAHEDKAALSVDLTNPDIQLGEREKLPRDTVFLQRTKFLWKAVCYERLSVRNYSNAHRRLRIDYSVRRRFSRPVRGARHETAAARRRENGPAGAATRRCSAIAGWTASSAGRCCASLRRRYCSKRTGPRWR